MLVYRRSDAEWFQYWTCFFVSIELESFIYLFIYFAIYFFLCWEWEAEKTEIHSFKLYYIQQLEINFFHCQRQKRLINGSKIKVGKANQLFTEVQLHSVNIDVGLWSV